MDDVFLDSVGMIAVWDGAGVKDEAVLEFL